MSLGPEDRAWAEAALGEPVRGARSVQSLWGGYGELLRVTTRSGRTAILKHIAPPPVRGRADRGHDRKLRSYRAEMAFYRHAAPRCRLDCRVPQPLALEEKPEGWRFLLEDLDAAGYGQRRGTLGQAELELCLGWLAALHGTFLGAVPEGLWKQGTYWHLATRPDELAAMPAGPLKDAAAEIDGRLRKARFRTTLHGDAKLENFCFGRGRVAAVDFQYAGAGVGVQDVAYLLASGANSDALEADPEPALQVYFRHLRRWLPEEVAAEVEAEWRGLHVLAWADFYRFWAGWAPGAWARYRHAGRLLKALSTAL